MWCAAQGLVLQGIDRLVPFVTSNKQTAKRLEDVVAEYSVQVADVRAGAFCGTLQLSTPFCHPPQRRTGAGNTSAGAHFGWDSSLLRLVPNISPRFFFLRNPGPFWPPGSAADSFFLQGGTPPPLFLSIPPPPPPGGASLGP